MNKLKLLKEYLESKYPHTQDGKVFDNSMSDGETRVVWPPHLTIVVTTFLDALNLGYHAGLVKSTTEYEKNIREIVTEVHGTGYNQGFADGNEQGFDEGVNAEIVESVIPSDAYDIEVFAVQPSNDFETGKQAFIGYKFEDTNGNVQFSFIQVQFSAPNLTLKSKINANNVSLDTKKSDN